LFPILAGGELYRGGDRSNTADNNILKEDTNVNMGIKKTMLYILSGAGLVIVTIIIQQCWSAPAVYPTRTDLKDVTNACMSSVAEVRQVCAQETQRIDRDKLDKDAYIRQHDALKDSIGKQLQLVIDRQKQDSEMLKDLYRDRFGKKAEVGKVTDSFKAKLKEEKKVN
jgi:hypothetical protein